MKARLKLMLLLAGAVLINATGCKKNDSLVAPSPQSAAAYDEAVQGIPIIAGKALVLYVNASAAAGGNGSSGAPFRKIEDALAAARDSVAATAGNLAT